MTKFTAGMLIGFGAALAGWWYYSKAEEMIQPGEPSRGEVIFKNTPVTS